MKDRTRRLWLAEDLVRQFAACVKSVQLYAPDHPIVTRSAVQLADTLERLHAESAETVIGILEHQIVVDGVPLLDVLGASDAVDQVRKAGIGRIAFDRGVRQAELLTFACRVSARPGQPGDALSDDDLSALSSEHIHVGRIRIQERVESDPADFSTIQQSYRNAVAGAEDLWHQAQLERRLDPGLAIGVVDGLATAVGQNRRALSALTTLYEYDNYTFTHMVNVSVLTMAQAQSIGIDDPLLRQFGLAGLMHDIGKIRTPVEILAKPDRLTEEEFAIMRRHPVDGAEMLRLQIELPPLTAVVAFEHHLRLDGTGYPGGVARSGLNLASQLCSIADVYDAMRAQRVYQRALPTTRILAVLEQNDGKRFDQRLVRRFSQLMGIYPVGNFVRLDTGEVAVVMRIHAPDPARPLVRVIAAEDGARLAWPRDIALWLEEDSAPPPPRIVSPLDPREIGIDPMPYLRAAVAS